MDQAAPQADADGWFAVPPDREPRELVAQDTDGSPWSYPKRYPQRIEDLEFVSEIRDEADHDGGVEYHEFVSVWEVPAFSDDQLDWQNKYERVRGAAFTSLATCRIFEITIHGSGAQTVQLWLDSDHPLQDSVFFNYADTGNLCLVVRRVTHVRFIDPAGVSRSKRPDAPEDDAPNFPYYVVQWGRTKSFTEGGTLNTVLLDAAGSDIERSDDASALLKTGNRYRARDGYRRNDPQRTPVTVPRFTYLNELSLMPHSETVMRAADRVAKRWSEAFRRSYYRPRLGDAQGGRGYEKQRAEWNSELGGSSSTDPPAPPVPKRELSEDAKQRMLRLWQGSSKKARREE